MLVPFFLPVLHFLADAASPATLDVRAQLREGGEVCAAAPVLYAPRMNTKPVSCLEVLHHRIRVVFLVPWQQITKELEVKHVYRQG